MRGIPYRNRPGIGFVLLVAATLSAIAFFAWGLRTPELDVVWRLQTELMVGRRGPLERWETDVLARSLRRHPTIAEDMLDDAPAGVISANVDGVVESGYAYLVRRSETAPTTLHLSAGAGMTAPLELVVRVGTHTDSRRVTPGHSAAVALPNGPYPQLIEVLAKPTREARRRRPPAFVARLEVTP